jgi:hypothetical protein
MWSYGLDPDGPPLRPGDRCAGYWSRAVGRDRDRQVQVRGVQRTSVDLHLYLLLFQPYLSSSR